MIIGHSGINSNPGIGASYVVHDKTYSMDVYNDYTLIAGYKPFSNFVTMVKIGEKSIPVDLLFQKHVYSSISVNARFLRPLAEYAMSYRAIWLPENTIPTDSVINTLIWSWATVLDQSFREVQTASRETTLKNAETSDLDIIGNVYHTRRLFGESDDDYRKRLSVITNVSIGFGTRANCEAIIDTANGILGCEVNTGPPGIIRVEFDNDAAMRQAYANRVLLESIIPSMIAAGISYSLYTPIKDYIMTLPVLGPDDSPYTMDILSKTYHQATYGMHFMQVLLNESQITVDILSQKFHDKSLPIESYINKFWDEQLLMDVLSRKTRDNLISMDTLMFLRNIFVDISMDTRILNQQVESSYDMDHLTSKYHDVTYNQYVYTVQRLFKTLPMDVLMFNPIAPYSMDVLNEKLASKGLRTRVSMVMAP